MSTTTTATTPSTASTTSRLAEIARSLADRPEEWIHRVRLSADGRWYERLHRDGDHEVWLISWLPGQATGFHDHGESSGAFAVALGSLEEHQVGQARTMQTGESWAFDRDYVHDVRNSSAAPAVSVHVYSPPLSTMNRYRLSGDGLVVLTVEQEEDW
ncbi:MAG: cysteine dioxygenase type [Actinoallomurus sp.]|nr:cysteine dioxygenase type [Actinoallomurus sp.]